MSRRSVLVVEDDDTIRRLLIECLKEGAHVIVDGARDGAEALHQMSTTSYDAVILDLVMPHMSGIDFLTSLQSMVSDPSIRSIPAAPPVIIVTSLTMEDLPDFAIERRFPSLVRDIFRKPADVAALVASVNACVHRDGS